MDHPSYEQVMLDVDRCAGRLEHIRQCYLHRTDDDEPPEIEDEGLEDEQREMERLSSADEQSDDDGDINPSTHDQTPMDISNCDSKRIRTTRDLQYQKKLKKKLARLIVNLLIKKPNLHYYQGFHDVCLTYMTIYGEEEAQIKLEHDIDTHFSIFMRPTMRETQEFLELIPVILGLHDKRTQIFLEQTEVGTIFALSWVITWFSHVIPNEHDVESIFTHLRGISDPHLILYLCAEVVLYKKDELLQLEPEMSIIHHFLCQVPRKEKLPIDELIVRACTSFQRWPPEFVKQKLEQYRRDRLRLHSYNLVRSLTQSFLPLITSLVTSPRSRTAIVLFVVASAIALQYDRWIK